MMQNFASSIIDSRVRDTICCAFYLNRSEPNGVLTEHVIQDSYRSKATTETTPHSRKKGKNPTPRLSFYLKHSNAVKNFVGNSLKLLNHRQYVLDPFPKLTLSQHNQIKPCLLIKLRSSNITSNSEKNPQ